MVDHLEDIISDVFVVHLTTYRVQLLLCVETKNKLSSYPMVDVALFLFYTDFFDPRVLSPILVSANHSINTVRESGRNSLDFCRRELGYK